MKVVLLSILGLYFHPCTFLQCFLDLRWGVKLLNAANRTTVELINYGEGKISTGGYRNVNISKILIVQIRGHEFESHSALKMLDACHGDIHL